MSYHPNPDCPCPMCKGATDSLGTLKPGDLIGGAHTPDLRRVERAIVRGLRDEFGKGKQSQLTHAEGFDICIAGTNVVIEVREAGDEHVESSLERYERTLQFIAQGNLNRIADLGAAGALAEVTNAALEALDAATAIAPQKPEA